MTKHLLLILALLCTVAQGAWAQTEVSTEEALRNAITNGANITLTDNITVASHITIPASSTVTINLGGFTLSGNGEALDGSDGSFSCIFIVAATGELILSNGTLADADNSETSNSTHNGGAIVNKGTVTLTDVNISNCKGYNGGAIRNNDGATLTFNSGTISGCSAQDCGGIYNAEGGTLYITGGTISDCTSNQGGGGVVNYGTATISGGTITGNYCKSRGGGVWNGSDATLTISGGSITGNTADVNGGGVFSYSSFSMSGAPTITDNTVDGSANNLYLNGSSTLINVTGSLSGANIKVTLQKRNRVMTSGYYDNNGNTDPATIFFPDYSGQRFFMDGNEVRHTTTLDGYTDVSTESDLNTAITDGAKIQLMADITLSNYVNISDSKSVTIDLNGYKLDRNLSERKDLGNVIRVQTGCTLTIQDSSGDNSGKITGGYDSDGGGICIYGTVNFEGGTITGCRATYGGAVYVVSGGSFTMTGGIITDNRADSDGGGIWTESDISMSGNPKVTDNEVSNLYLNGSSTKINCGTFESGASIGVLLSDNNRVFTSGYGSNNNNAQADTYFSADLGGATLSTVDGEAKISVSGVEYVECSWSGSNTGGHVVKKKKICPNYYNLNGTSRLGSAWYYASYNDTYDSNRWEVSGDAKLIIKDGVTLTCNKGIYIKDGCTLTIYAQSGGTGKLDIPKVGTDHAAIGGNNTSVGGHLVIHGGTVIATASSNNAAGIGGGDGSDTGMRSVTIWDGNVTAHGESSAAGIGAGKNNDVVPTVTIYGGTVTAESESKGAGIGGGENRGNNTIKIYGGTVTATGGNKGAGIGGGYDGNQDSPIYIYGGTVNATGGEGAEGGAGIGAGGIKGSTSNSRKGGDVYIYGGTVIAKGGYTCDFVEEGGGSGIGGGGHGKGGNVNIYGGNVQAYGGGYKVKDICQYPAAAIGGGYRGSGGSFNMTGGSLYVRAHTPAVLIGHGYGDQNKDNGTFTLADNIMMTDASSVIYSADERYSKATEETDDRTKVIAALFSVCNHSGGSCSYKDADYHTISCEYCAVGDEAHTYGSNGKCSKCGCTAPAESKTVTIYMANTDGTAYDEGQCSTFNVQCSTYTLPSCTSVPGDMTFIGWAPGAPANGETVMKDGEEMLKAAGETITVSDDVSFKARYQYVWTGSGTEDDPFQIDNSEGWNKLATNVKNGTTYSGKHFKLTADISVTQTVSVSGNQDFRGTFDGDGHTLDVNISGQNHVAPFRYVNGATIKNLKVTGTIKTSNTYASGIVGRVGGGDNTIINCVSSATINSTREGWTNNGGLLGNVRGGTTTISGCVFNGKFAGENATNWRGLVGYIETGCTVNITDCIAALSEFATSETNYNAIYYNRGTINLNNVYYTLQIGTAQCTRAYTVESGTDGLTLDYGTPTTNYSDYGIKTYDFDQGDATTANGLLFQDKLYTDGTTKVTFNAATAEDKVATGMAASAGTFGGDAQNGYTLAMAAANSTVTATIDDRTLTALELRDAPGTNDPTNATVLAGAAGQTYNVTLSGRTLYKDGSWNTLCLPFDVSADKISVHPQLQNCTIMELDVDDKWTMDNGKWIIDNENGKYRTGFDAATGTLYLYFKTVTEIEEGVPYLIQWTKPDGYDANPSSFDFTPTFYGSYIKSDEPDNVESTDGYISFVGNYDPVTVGGDSQSPTGDKSILYLGSDNSLYYPNGAMSIKSFRAYFQLNGITAGDITNGARLFFGIGDETTGVVLIDNGQWIMDNSAEANSSLFTLHSSLSGWYDLQGRRLSVSSDSSVSSVLPKGVYIKNGKKLVIK